LIVATTSGAMHGLNGMREIATKGHQQPLLATYPNHCYYPYCQLASDKMHQAAGFHNSMDVKESGNRERHVKQD
jgi:hypothetical protein